MRAAWVAGVLFGVVVVGAAPGASAAGGPGEAGEATVDDVATAIATDGWYADGDAVGDREQLDHVAERLALGGDPLGFALLAAEPAGSSTAFAEQVLDALPSHGEHSIRTVVVLSDADVGVVSDTWSDDAIDGALDDTIDDLRADPTDGLEALSAALADQPAGFGDSSSDGDDGSDSGGGGSNAGGLIAFGLVAVVALSVGSRYLSGDAALDGDGDDGGSSSSSSWSRRSRRSFSSFSRRSSSSGSRSRSSRRSSSSSSHRGRGGRRL